MTLKCNLGLFKSLKTLEVSEISNCEPVGQPGGYLAVRLAILVSHTAAVSQLLCQSVRQSGAQSVGQTDSQLVRQMNRGGKFLDKLWCCVSGRV